MDDHMKDYINIHARLKAELENHIPEYGGVTKEQLQFRLDFFTRKLNTKSKPKITDGVA
jgi:hypothetical protein